MPFRYNAVAVKFMLQRALGDEIQGASEYRHIAAEIERFSTDPELDEIFRAVLQKAAEKVRAIAAQEEEHRKTLTEMMSSLGLSRVSAAPAAASSELKGSPVKPGPQ